MTPLLPKSSVATAPLIAHSVEEQIFDDSRDIAPGDAPMLIVDDDPHYSRVLLGLARGKGFKGVIARNGQQALQFARQFRPGAITLDIFLPDMLGWTVLNNLKLDPATRHIPVQIISLEEDLQYGLAHGAFGCLVKPVTTSAIEASLDRLRNFIARHPKRLLVVESNEAESQSMIELLDYADIEIVVARTAQSALVALLKEDFDCCVIDLRLTDMSGVELLDLIKSQVKLVQLPVIVYTNEALDQEEEFRLRAMAQIIVLKDVRAPARLFDATALFLHRNLAALPASKQKLIEYLNGSNEALRGRKVLVVDDDARNIFALATILENHEMETISATSGRQAISIIESTPDLSAVLMDIMMPEIEGYETIRRIRQNLKLRSLPIIALTAKAMKGDREKCLQAGASEYVAKPVNAEQLLSMLRLWSLP
jgi:CheY-like chemotaxis protein